METKIVKNEGSEGTGRLFWTASVYHDVVVIDEAEKLEDPEL
jgi:hypothetical protein